MSESDPSVDRPGANAAGPAPSSSAAPAQRRPAGRLVGAARARAIAAGLLTAGVLATAALAWHAERRVAQLEKELVRRQNDSGEQATEARVLAKRAEETARDGSAKVALLEARIAEVTVQRGQLEDVIQSLSRSRDENLLVDVEAAIRLALQQTAITGSAEPLVATLKQSDERLARYDQTRLDGVRRAIARDLDRVNSASVADIPSLGIKLDEAVRLVDEMPLLAGGEPRRPTPAAAVGTGPATGDGAPAPAAGASEAGAGSFWEALWPSAFTEAWSRAAERVWAELKSLLRVTRIDRPEAMLLAPEQAFFVRENLKLRLLNARLALLSRHFDTAQSDLQAARTAVERYFDPGARRTVVALDLLKQVSTQARQVGVPRPDDTLAALAAVSAGR